MFMLKKNKAEIDPKPKITIVDQLGSSLMIVIADATAVLGFLPVRNRVFCCL